MGIPVVNGYSFATWNGIIYPSRRPVVTFDSPVLRGTGASVLPERAPLSVITCHSFVASRAEADARIRNYYLLLGYLITANDDEGTLYSNLFVKDVQCSKPMRVQGETNEGTSGPVWHFITQWSFIAPLPENS